MENGIVQAQFLGVQRHFLCDLQSRGADALLEPDAMFGLCLHTALAPRVLESSSLKLHKRECLLSVALDHGLVSFLSQCVTQFGSAGTP